MSRVPGESRPSIITLISDFGMQDSYVAEMKAVLLREAPAARLIDVTHEIPHQSILAASVVLERVLRGFPARSVHLAVVDPGVGTARRAIAVEIGRQTVVCPDNGLITWSWRRLGAGKAFTLPTPPGEISATFHGRDVFAIFAGKIAAGRRASRLGSGIARPVLLDVAPAPASAGSGEVIYIDHFGNAVTNISREAIDGAVECYARGKRIASLVRTYADVPPNAALALIGSGGLLEIAVRDGSAAERLRLKVGDMIRLDRAGARRDSRQGEARARRTRRVDEPAK